MSWKLVAQGGLLDATDLGRYEHHFDEGDRGLLELDLRMPVSDGVAQSLENALKEAGVQGVKVTTASPMLKIYFRKGFPWLAVIAAAILGIIVLAILIIGWRLYREVVPDIPGADLITWGLIIAVVVLGITVFMRRRAREGV